MTKNLLNRYFVLPSSEIITDEIKGKLKLNHAQSDKLMLTLILIHWVVVSTIFPLVFSNFSLGLIGGGLISASAFLAYREFKGTMLSMFIMTLGLSMFTIILIQQSLGKIEAHFHVWMLLGMLLGYKDIRPVVWSSLIVVFHHLSFNTCQQFDLSIAGVPLVIYETGSSWFITILHAAFVVPSTIIFARLCSISILEFIQVESANQNLELQIKENEEIAARIQEQNDILMELSTPVTQLWDGIMILPLTGIIDTKRSQDIMDSMIDKLESTTTKAFIIDISGISIMDTAVANHIIKINKTARLMGSQCVISGVSGAVAQTMVELGIAVDEIKTTASIQDALAYSLELTDAKIVNKNDLRSRLTQ